MKTFWNKVQKYKKMLLVILVVATASTVGLYLRQPDPKTAATSQQTVTVERGEVSLIVSASGSIEPVNTVDISSQITAQIKEVKVKENDKVTAGQVLVVLEDDELQPQLIQAKEKVNNAAANYERNLRLNSVGAVAAQQLDVLRMEYSIAQANYDQVLSKLKETVITAPIDGTVIGKPLPVGQTVAQGVTNPTVILTVADMSKMQIEAKVDQTDIGKVAVGQKVTFTVDAYPGKTFKGAVANVSQKANTEQSVIYYTVTIDVFDGENLLKPSMDARVSIVVGEAKGALTLPLAAIRTNKDGKYVVIQGNDGQLANITVTTGIMGEDRVEITSGLNEGDTVVLSQPKPAGQAAGQTSAGQRGGSGTSNPMNGMMRRM